MNESGEMTFEEAKAYIREKHPKYLWGVLHYVNGPRAIKVYFPPDIDPYGRIPCGYRFLDNLHDRCADYNSNFSGWGPMDMTFFSNYWLFVAYAKTKGINYGAHR